MKRENARVFFKILKKFFAVSRSLGCSRAASGLDRMIDWALEQTEELTLAEQAQVGFPFGDDGLGPGLFVAHCDLTAGTVVLMAYHQKVGLAGDSGFDDRAHIDCPLHCLSPVNGEFSSEDQGFLIQGMMGIEEGHLGPDTLGLDGGLIARDFSGLGYFGLPEGQV